MIGDVGRVMDVAWREGFTTEGEDSTRRARP